MPASWPGSPIKVATRRELSRPAHTLERGWGSCRDMAVLFIEAVRTLGFGARIVSGYLHNPAGDIAGSEGAGTTHAWAEVYVSGAGWITFDPTNRNVGGANLIPVAVGRDIRQVMPVAGSFVGMSDADIVARGEIARLADQIGNVVVLGPTEVLRVAERGCNGGAD